MLALCRLAGLRRGEALRLQWADVDFDRRRLTVRLDEGEREGTKQRRRIVPMVGRMHDILIARFDEAQPGESVAGVGPNNLDRDLRAIVRRAGLTPWNKLFHTLRKNCETDWLATYPVMAVCEWLGHSPTVAAEHYHRSTEQLMDQAAGVAPSEADQLRAQLADAKRDADRLRQRLIRLRRAARTVRGR